MHREFIQVGDRVLEAVLEEDEDGWWVVEVPELPGCVSQGRSYAEALENIREAAELYLSRIKNFCRGPVGDGDQERILVEPCVTERDWEALPRLEPIEPIAKTRGGNVADIIIEERR